MGQHQSPEEVAIVLQEMRTQFTTETIVENKSVTEFDELTYTGELRRRLIRQQPLPNSALVRPGNERAENTRLAILENDETLEGRINIADTKSVDKKTGEMIQMKVSLSIGEQLNEIE